MKLPAGDTHFKNTDIYQLRQYAIAVSLCRTRTLAIDIGAHVGIFTERFCRDFEQTIAFEPIHTDLLRENMREFTNCRIEPTALSNRTGTAQFSVNLSNSGEARINPQGTHTAQITTVDSYRLTEISIIKIDAEGHELPILQGAEQTLRQNDPVLLIEIELHSPAKSETEQFLTDLGYQKIERINADTIWQKNRLTTGTILL